MYYTETFVEEETYDYAVDEETEATPVDPIDDTITQEEKNATLYNDF